MALKIVHFSVTPLAGGPYRLSSAIKRYTDHDVRLVDLNRWGRFWHDVVFSEDTELAVHLAENADIIHLYNSIDLNNAEFRPINFRRLWNNGTRIIRHFRSEPVTVSRNNRQSVQELLSCPLPSLVIGQYPERFYPKARVVRNNLPINDPAYLPTNTKCKFDILFTPTKRSAIFEKRWNTKGAPETKRVMKSIASKTGCNTKIITGMPIKDILKAKQESYIVLDDMVTGSYHMSGMEGLSMAKPTLCYLDKRIDRVIREITGAMDHPFVNVTVDNAKFVIEELLSDRNAGVEIGNAGRKWMERYWDEELIAQEFSDIYAQLMEDPTKVQRQESLKIENSAQKFFVFAQPDAEYRQLVKRLWPKPLRLLRRVSLRLRYIMKNPKKIGNKLLVRSKQLF